MQPERAQPSRPEELLLDYAERLKRHRTGRRALWFHLSRLARQNRHESDIRLAANLVVPLANRFHGEVFALRTGDVVACLKDADLKAVDKTVFDLAFSFAHDALMQRADREGTHVFLTTYDMNERYDAFMERVKAAAGGSAPSAAPAPETDAPAGLGARLMLSREDIKRQDLGASTHIDTAQGRVAVERMLSLRTIASFAPNARPRPWGIRESARLEAIETFAPLAMALARRQIAEATALCEIERVLLSGLAQHLKARGEANHIVAFHLEALLSPEFLTFERQIAAAESPKPMIAMLAGEIAKDPESAQYLKTFLKERNYRVGATDLTLNALGEHQAMLGGLHFVEIEHGREIDARDGERLMRLLALFGEGGVVLSDLRTQKALDVATRAGIKLFSGRIVDEAL